MNTTQHTPFRSKRDRQQEVDLLKKYRGIGIAAVAAAGQKAKRATATDRMPVRPATETMD